MNKALNKVFVKCIMYTFILSLPFVFLHYLSVLNYKKNSGVFSGNYELILEFIQLACTIGLAVFFRNRYKSIIKENNKASGKYMIIISILFLLILILYFTDTLRHICFRFFLNNVFRDISNVSVFVNVFLERVLRGELLVEILLCLTICFSGNLCLLSKEQKCL